MVSRDSLNTKETIVRISMNANLLLRMTITVLPECYFLLIALFLDVKETILSELLESSHFLILIEYFYLP